MLARQTNLGGARTPSRLELNYVEAADDVFAMVGRGEFPAPDAPTGPRRGAPRVGDGLVHLNSEGEVLYASPNALSCFHRLGVVGDLVGRSLVEVTAEPASTQDDTVDETLPLVLMGRAPWRIDVEARGVALSLRAMPLIEHGERVGALLLCRDVSELHRRERELITKDATIREIHHRVKNNLQTVSALLRLQARRIESAGGDGRLWGRRCAASRRSPSSTRRSSSARRVSVPFDALLERGLRLTADLPRLVPVRTAVRRGRSGRSRRRTPTRSRSCWSSWCPTRSSTAARGGAGHRRGRSSSGRTTPLRVEVADDGPGLPDRLRPRRQGLGTQIVLALVAER